MSLLAGDVVASQQPTPAANGFTNGHATTNGHTTTEQQPLSNGHSSELSVSAVAPEDIDRTFRSEYIDLVSAPLGSRILSLSDEFFASASNLTNPSPPIRRPGHFVATGAWYDGWETRRHNAAPFDYVVLRLGVAAGRVAGIEVDTAHFNGNHAPEVAVQGVYVTPSAGESEADVDARVASADFAGWDDAAAIPLLARQDCGPSARHGWRLPTISAPVTHVRLLMYPDGGIARFRLYGLAVPVFPDDASAVLELSAAQMGGRAVGRSDEHFGVAANLLLPGRGKDMGDGWETKRSRGAHVDWVVVRLGAVAEGIEKVVVDTMHFRGNFPREVRVYAAFVEDGGDPDGADEAQWTEILGGRPTGADKELEFGQGELTNVEGRKWSHAKLVIVPDGGVKRFRVFARRTV